MTLAGMKCVVSMSKITGGGQWVCDNTGGSQCIDRNTLVDQKNIGVLSESFGDFFGLQLYNKNVLNFVMYVRIWHGLEMYLFSVLTAYECFLCLPLDLSELLYHDPNTVNAS